MAEPITIRGLDDVRALIAGLGDDLAGVQVAAQNKMAYELMLAERDQMRTDIDRPTPFSVSAVSYKKADATEAFSRVWGAPKGEGAAVFMQNAFAQGSRVGPDEYLGVQVVGGQTAGPRRSEKALRMAGVIPEGKVIVPAKGVKLNRYGNLEGGVIARMLMDFGMNPYAQTKDKNFALFGPRGNAKGVLARVLDRGESTWLPYLYFVSRRSYRKRFDFYGRGDREVSARFGEIWGGYLDKALAKRQS